MRFDLRLAVPVVALLTHGTACKLHSCDTLEYAHAGPTTNPNDANRAIAEADIVQLDAEQQRLYVVSRSGSLAVVDAATPSQLRLLGKTTLSGVPFELYRRGDVLITMSNQAVTGDGQLVGAAAEGAIARQPDPRSSALVAAVDVRDPAQSKTIATLKVPGEIADSRLVGHILYLTTYQNASCYGCGTDGRTFVTSIDVSTPSAPKQVEQLAFAPVSATSYGSWTPWKRSIIATDRRLYVGGLTSESPDRTKEGIIEVIDIADPSGHMKRGATLNTAGPITSRWQMDEHDGVLRVVSQHGAGRTTNGERAPEVETFRVETASAVTPLGHLHMSLPRLEGLKSVRFDGTRAYAITFQQTDPLFTLDLTDPSAPQQKGELEIPGWVYYLEPHGDRLLGLGLDRTNKLGNLNVSLFDVSDLAKPTLLDRASFGPTDGWSDAMITTEMLAEDQDRIQKAFRVFDDGLIAVPFSMPDWRTSCGGKGAGIQLIQWSKSSLTKKAHLPMANNPRRALRRDHQTVIGISDSSVTSFQIADLNHAVQTAEGPSAPACRANRTGAGWAAATGAAICASEC